MLQKLIEQAGDLYHNDALLEASDRTDDYRFNHYVYTGGRSFGSVAICRAATWSLGQIRRDGCGYFGTTSKLLKIIQLE
jgi:hypothetical protein